MPLSNNTKALYLQLTSQQVSNEFLTFDFQKPIDGAIGSGKLKITNRTNEEMSVNYSIHGENEHNAIVKIGLNTKDKGILISKHIDSKIISGMILTLPFIKLIPFLEGENLLGFWTIS